MSWYHNIYLFRFPRRKGIKNRVDRNHKGIKAVMSASWWHEMPSSPLQSTASKTSITQKVPSAQLTQDTVRATYLHMWRRVDQNTWGGQNHKGTLKAVPTIQALGCSSWATVPANLVIVAAELLHTAKPPGHSGAHDHWKPGSSSGLDSNSGPSSCGGACDSDLLACGRGAMNQQHSKWGITLSSPQAWPLVPLVHSCSFTGFDYLHCLLRPKGLQDTQTMETSMNYLYTSFVAAVLHPDDTRCIGALLLGWLIGSGSSLTGWAVRRSKPLFSHHRTGQQRQNKQIMLTSALFFKPG